MINEILKSEYTDKKVSKSIKYIHCTLIIVKMKMLKDEQVSY